MRAARSSTEGVAHASPLSGRRLSSAQANRLDRLCRAARDLASEGGYAAVTMRDVAERAGVGLATVYRYFASKDHLIAEVHARCTSEVVEELRRRPPRSRSTAARVTAVFDRMFEATAADTNLASAAISAVTSGDAFAASREYWYDRVMDPYMEAALGGAPIAQREEVTEILGHTFFSLMIALASGRKTLAECQRLMARAIARMLREP
jgi:AcrR family transcriptional regulator